MTASDREALIAKRTQQGEHPISNEIADAASLVPCLAGIGDNDSLPKWVRGICANASAMIDALDDELSRLTERERELERELGNARKWADDFAKCKHREPEGEIKC